MDKCLLLMMIFAPLLAAVVVLLLGSNQLVRIRQVSLAAALLSLLCALHVAWHYQSATGRTAEEPFASDPAFEIRVPWLSYLPSPSGAPSPSIEFHLGVDGLSLWLIVLTALLMVSAVLISWKSIQTNPSGYYALLMLLASGMLGVFCALDIVLFYIFFEFTLLPLFFLIGLWGGPQKRYAARKFFLYTLAGSLVTLVGLVAIVLSLVGQGQPMTFSLPELARQVAIQPLPGELQQWIFLALFAGLAIKVPLFPFHTWLPLAHVEAPTAGSVLLAGVLLKLGTYGFLRLCIPMVPLASVQIGLPLVGVLATVGILYGSFCALAQTDIKKMVAYSSVAHLGFCMLGLFALNAEGMSGALLQMVNHGLSTGLLFLLVGMIYDRYHTRQMTALGGLNQRMPILGLIMMFTCLSSIGLPGLNGFVGEFLCLSGMFARHPIYAVWGTLGIILGAWYLLTFVMKCFHGPLKEPHVAEGAIIPDMDRRELSATLPLVALCLWIGLYPKPFLDRMKPEMEALSQRIKQAQKVQVYR